MPEFHVLLPQLRTRISQGSGKRFMNEQNTKASLIDPVLRALGWDTEDINEVAREYKPRRADNPVDYALLSQRTPRLFIEAKALDQNLDDRKWAGQIMGYAGVAGVEWVVLTNGDEWRIYNSHAAVAVDEKLFRAVRISDEGTLAQETLALLAKEQWDGKRIELLWQVQFVDRKVRDAVEGIFGNEPDIRLVKAIQKLSPGLGPKEIRASLGRARVKLDFPSHASLPPMKTPSKAKQLGSSSVTGSSSRTAISLRDLIAAGIIKVPLQMERTYKGKELSATISTDGRIILGRQAFGSLSAAGGAAMQTVLRSPKPPACAGWGFWHYRDQDGKLLPIDSLRLQYLATKS